MICEKCIHNFVCKYGEARSDGIYCTGEKCKQFEGKQAGIYVIEYGSSYDSDPWEIIGYCNTKEEAQEFIDKQFCPSLYHCTEVKHISQIKKEQ